MSERIRVFAYGTLTGEARARGGQEAFVHGCLYAHGIPAALPGGKGDPRIRGVVYEVSPDELERLDMCEGVAQGFYRRQLIRLTDGRPAWMYTGADCMMDAYGALLPGWVAIQPDPDGIVEWQRPAPEEALRGREGQEDPTAPPR